ncbi:MAG: hypothetical protein RR235_05025 [Oscillospiraceae bacterium]
MPGLNEMFGYSNRIYAPLKEPARRVVEAFQNAARFLDTVQESVYIDAGMPCTSRVIHRLAHDMPKRFDVLGDALHERRLKVEYPPTPELTEPIEDIDKALEIVTGTLDEIHEALEAFRFIADRAEFRPFALKADELIAQNSAEYTRILQLWAMWDSCGKANAAAYDSWVGEFDGKSEGGD